MLGLVPLLLLLVGQGSSSLVPYLGLPAYHRFPKNNTTLPRAYLPHVYPQQNLLTNSRCQDCATVHSLHFTDQSHTTFYRSGENSSLSGTVRTGPWVQTGTHAHSSFNFYSLLPLILTFYLPQTIFSGKHSPHQSIPYPSYILFTYIDTSSWLRLNQGHFQDTIH